jgi:hypothetical protein
MRRSELVHSPASNRRFPSSNDSSADPADLRGRGAPTSRNDADRRKSSWPRSGRTFGGDAPGRNQTCGKFPPEGAPLES